MTDQIDLSGEPASPVVMLHSRHDFAATIARLKDALAARGITVFADIDQQDAARGVGMTLRPTRLLLFGNPQAGTPIMAADPLSALELPLRAVIWEEAGRGVQVAYLDVTKTLGSGGYRIDPALYAPLAKMPALLRSALEQV
jgi:uncharacterized protein (DUF302 family)